jgi:hypothetical protein
MSKILELVKATEAAEIEREAAEATALQELLEARMAEARAMLDSEVIGEYDIEVMRHDVDAAVLRIAPRVWRGLVHFNMFTYKPGNWRVKMERDDDDFYLGSAETWGKEHAIKFLVALHRQFERQRVSEVERYSGRLDGNYGDADEAHAVLMELAPERAAEWDTALEKQRKVVEEKEAAKRQADDDRRQAFGKYLAALVEYVAAREAARAANQATYQALKARVEAPVAVRDIEYAVVAQDEEGGQHVETRTALAYADSGEPHQGNTWTVLERGRPRVWVFRTIVRISDAYTARPDEDKYSDAFMRRSTKFGAVVFSHQHESGVDAALEAMTWPKAPRAEAFGFVDLSIDERRRLAAVLGWPDESADDANW